MRRLSGCFPQCGSLADIGTLALYYLLAITVAVVVLTWLIRRGVSK